ncbi:MAG: archease [Planctomycetes bacterium]|nr:archease [Planctomycetota bacterium]
MVTAKPQRRYEFLAHTADIGIRVRARSLKGLFTNAAFALFDISTVLGRVRPARSLRIELTALDIEELLQGWLGRLLSEWTLNGLLLSNFQLLSIKKGLNNKIHLTARVWGEVFDKTRHKIKKEIKAVTFHDLKVTKKKEGFEASVVFDV